MLLARLRVVCCGDEDGGPLLVRYKPVDLEFTVLLWLPRSLLVIVIVSTASVVAFDSGILRLLRGGAIFSWRWKGIRKLRLKLGVMIRYVWLGAAPVSPNVPGTST